MDKVKKFLLVKIALILYVLAFILKRDVFYGAIEITFGFLKEMFQVLPPIMVISALITVWVPSNIIERGLGVRSGIKGKLISLVIGSLSAGPIYAAFPATLVLFKKGASISNVVVILSSWAVIKIPMLFVEVNFLGLKFTATRFILTVPAILIMGFVIDKLVKREDIGVETPKEVQLPNLNCGACGYNNCNSLNSAIKSGTDTKEKCIVLNRN